MFRPACLPTRPPGPPSPHPLNILALSLSLSPCLYACMHIHPSRALVYSRAYFARTLRFSLYPLYDAMYLSGLCESAPVYVYVYYIYARTWKERMSHDFKHFCMRSLRGRARLTAALYSFGDKKKCFSRSLLSGCTYTGSLYVYMYNTREVICLLNARAPTISVYSSIHTYTRVSICAG